MRVLGIDPGTLNLGYGIVDEEGGNVVMVDCGVLSQPSKVVLEQRLAFLYHELGKILVRHLPDEMAVEEPFVAGNVRSALALGRAQAIAILAATNMKLPVFRYSPTQVKLQVTSYGNSSKEQVKEMVRIQLGLTQPIESSDAADALAVAICHLHQRQIDHLLASQ
jgi:crossover junction endodeoxyribonuclease RuvC